MQTELLHRVELKKGCLRFAIVEIPEESNLLFFKYELNLDMRRVADGLVSLSNSCKLENEGREETL